MNREKEDNSNEDNSLELKRRIIRIWKLRTRLMIRKIIRYNFKQIIILNLANPINKRSKTNPIPPLTYKPSTKAISQLNKPSIVIYPTKSLTVYKNPKIEPFMTINKKLKTSINLNEIIM